MNRFILLLSLALLAGCGLQQPNETARSADVIQTQPENLSLFSNKATGGLPEGWEPMVIFRTKKQTRYELVNEQSQTVLHAHAQNASSGLMQKVSIDPLPQPWLHWQWKISDLVASINGVPHATEDSPARIILGFDGDKDALPFSDQILFETARIFTGYEFPYATLMYVWDDKIPVGTVIPSHRSSRIKSVVVASGPGGVGEWRRFARNIIDDYRRAFGEHPGRLIGIGVLTDNENAGETAEAWYGDIRLRPDAGALPGQSRAGQ